MPSFAWLIKFLETAMSGIRSRLLPSEDLRFALVGRMPFGRWHSAGIRDIRERFIPGLSPDAMVGKHITRANRGVRTRPNQDCFRVEAESRARETPNRGNAETSE